MICGRVLPSAGTVAFDGADITRMQPWDRVARGIVYTFQITSVFKRLTCRDNVALAARNAISPRPKAHRFALPQRSSTPRSMKPWHRSASPPSPNASPASCLMATSACWKSPWASR